MMRRAQPWLGTLVEISVADSDDGGAVTRAFGVVARVHALMSFHAADSDIARLNRAAPGSDVEVDHHTWQVLYLADAVRAASDGIFNIACAPRLVDWGCLPSPGGAAPAYAPGQAVFTLLDEGRVRKLAAGWVDLGGIAKGYAVDLAIAALQADGIEAACVNAGGDLRVFGAAFPVQLRDPRAPQRPGAELVLRDAALATSASYFSLRAHGAGQVSALLDGRDGQALVGRTSVSVCAARCAVADALTKVVLASGDPQHPALAAMGATAFII